MDMPKGKTFALYAPYADKSLMRNNLAYQLANDIASTSDDGGYNSWWAPRTKYCELFIIAAQDEAEYMGVYVFLERIDQQEERVDIRKLQPPKENTSLDSLDISGGYIWQRNWVDPGDVTFETPLNRFVVEYPESKDIVPPFLDYLSGFVSDVENELYSLAPDEVSGSVSLNGFFHFWQLSLYHYGLSLRTRLMAQCDNISCSFFLCTLDPHLPRCVQHQGLYRLPHLL
eukprot:GEZU01026171.1.p1 GENE.GEZU01026171.1~~GEZU01026171.1.p1  ORF type:complete len:229 (-),score=32.73 GEZU01026171.1:680-1366(-)